MAQTESYKANLLQYLTTGQVSEMLGISEITLRIWRTQGKGPRWAKLGSAVRYDLADVQAWIESRKVGGEAA